MTDAPEPADDSQRSDEAEGPLTRTEYFAERALLLEARQRSYERAEQMVAGGAAGALILSVTFLEKIAPRGDASQRVLLLASWVLLLGSLASSLLGQYLSARAFDTELDRLDATVGEEPLPKNPWTTWNRVSGVLGSILLILGIGLLAWFAYVNAPFSHGGTQ